MLDGGESGPAVVPGDPRRSLLVRAVRHADESLKMPPNKPLPARGPGRPGRLGRRRRAPGRSRLATRPIAGPDALGLRAAPDRRRRPPTRPAGPRSRSTGSSPPGIGPTGCSPSRRPTARTLIRRAYFDLIGLPPEPERVEAFVADERPDAFARLVDELLASPHYGERWGRYWLDLARYADTAGRQLRLPDPAGVPLSRLRHRRVQRRPPLRPVPPRAARRRHPGRRRPAATTTPGG